jgi:hypothetical protein
MASAAVVSRTTESRPATPALDVCPKNAAVQIINKAILKLIVSPAFETFHSFLRIRCNDVRMPSRVRIHLQRIGLHPHARSGIGASNIETLSYMFHQRMGPDTRIRPLRDAVSGCRARICWVSRSASQGPRAQDVIPIGSPCNIPRSRHPVIRVWIPIFSPRIVRDEGSSERLIAVILNHVVATQSLLPIIHMRLVPVSFRNAPDPGAVRIRIRICSRDQVPRCIYERVEWVRIKTIVSGVNPEVLAATRVTWCKRGRVSGRAVVATEGQLVGAAYYPRRSFRSPVGIPGSECRGG